MWQRLIEILPVLEHRNEALAAPTLTTSLWNNQKQIIRPCRVAIFLNIWTSIFSAAFFAYVQPAGTNDVEIVLYFTRLFSDLLGRPLARCPRPWFCRTKEQIVMVIWFSQFLVLPLFKSCYQSIQTTFEYSPHAADFADCLGSNLAYVCLFLVHCISGHHASKVRSISI